MSNEKLLHEGGMLPAASVTVTTVGQMPAQNCKNLSAFVLKSAGRSAIMPLGNHDGRLETQYSAQTNTAQARGS